MLGRITSIEEILGVCRGPHGLMRARDSRDAMDGYRVATDAHVVWCLIQSDQQCCEKWGYFVSDHDPLRFIGATLIEVRLTDKALNRKRVEESGYYEDEGGIQFIDFATDRGVFQVAVYNAHNGSYGHSVLILLDGDPLLDDVL